MSQFLDAAKDHHKNIQLHLFGNSDDENPDDTGRRETDQNYQDNIASLVSKLDWTLAPVFHGNVESEDWIKTELKNPTLINFSTYMCEDFSVSSAQAQERLHAVEATSDGFVLAQKDLDMRGPGEFLGTRQAGLPDLKLASVTDLRLVEAAREAARGFFKTDPELQDPDNRLLARRLAQFWRGPALSLVEGKGEVS